MEGHEIRRSGRVLIGKSKEASLSVFCAAEDKTEA